jgi:hypothetical protein
VANAFISHRSADAALSARLAADLRGAGHTVWLDDDIITVGHSIVAQINDGLNKLDFLILCYSSAGVESPWMSREWMSSLARQLDAQGVTILPVLFPGASPAAILADVKYANFAGEWDVGLRELLYALAARRL